MHNLSILRTSFVKMALTEDQKATIGAGLGATAGIPIFLKNLFTNNAIAKEEAVLESEAKKLLDSFNKERSGVMSKFEDTIEGIKSMLASGPTPKLMDSAKFLAYTHPNNREQIGKMMNLTMQEYGIKPGTPMDEILSIITGKPTSAFTDPNKTPRDFLNDFIKEPKLTDRDLLSAEKDLRHFTRARQGELKTLMDKYKGTRIGLLEKHRNIRPSKGIAGNNGLMTLLALMATGAGAGLGERLATN